MSDPGQSSYDVVPYPAFPFPQSHPDRLATVATLLGLTPPGVERCRVLELGCASGGNLLPLAVSLPQSTFLGIDLSSKQVADGQKTSIRFPRGQSSQHRPDAGKQFIHAKGFGDVIVGT